MTGSPLCFAHDPELDEKRTAARRRGGEHGQRAVLGPESPEFALRDGGEVADFAVAMINNVVRGKIDPKVANAASCWVNIYLRARELETIEQRVSALETARNSNSNPCLHLEGAEALLRQEVTP